MQMKMIYRLTGEFAVVLDDIHAVHAQYFHKRPAKPRGHRKSGAGKFFGQIENIFVMLLCHQKGVTSRNRNYYYFIFKFRNYYPQKFYKTEVRL